MRSFAHDLKDQSAPARPRVEIDDDHLLPCSEKELSVRERNRERWLEQRRSNVAGAIIVAPGIVMVIGRALWNDSLKEFRQVLHQPRLKLHGCYAGSGTGNEDRRLSLLQVAL